MGEAAVIDYPSPRRVVPTRTFTYRGWSVRPHQSGAQYRIYRLRDRSYSEASLWPASDRSCWIVSNNRAPIDARTSFWAALDLAIDRISQA